MASSFGKLFADRARPTLNDVFAESVEVRPFTAGELSRGAPSGPAYIARAIVDMPEEAVVAAGAAEAAKGEVVVTQPQAEFAMTTFGPGRPRVAGGFEIVLIERPGSPRWRVRGDPREDGVSAMIAFLERVA
jgi:hypothetical protein